MPQSLVARRSSGTSRSGTGDGTVLTGEHGAAKIIDAFRGAPTACPRSSRPRDALETKIAAAIHSRAASAAAAAMQAHVELMSDVAVLRSKR
jgi:hypothetical protein